MTTRNRLILAATACALLAAPVRTAWAQHLVLYVNPYSGVISIQNPYVSSIAQLLDGYQITGNGNLVPDPTNTLGVGWDSLSDAGQTGWEEVAPSTNALSELNLATTKSIPPGGIVNLGRSFSTSSFPGLKWAYTTRAAGQEVPTNPGAVVFAGGLQLQVINVVNPGNAIIETRTVLLNQETNQSFTFDAYSIRSASGSLNPAGFNGYDSRNVAGWESVAPSANSLSELNLSGSSALAPGQALMLGTAFTTNGTPDVTLEFHPSGSIGTIRNGSFLYRNQMRGDANADGIVNIFDINLVSSHWSTSDLLGDINFDGTVNIFDINLISSNWGNVLAGGGTTAVTEPAAGELFLAMLAATSFALGVRRFGGTIRGVRSRGNE